ncbi:Protein of unknown function [Streptococcus thermophilus]|nr:Protein of unknown function [Streptococcus thermophilus]
MSRLAL